jgi:squalene-associated FAD-dependent desaturase
VDRDAHRVAGLVIIGAGWAGCAAAVELAQRGHRVALHEAAAGVGGRARCVVRDGLPLDNGEHLLLGAYVDTLALAATLRDGDAHAAWRIAPLAIRPLAKRQHNAITFATHDLPGSLGLAAGFMLARGLGWRERVATLRWFAQQRTHGFRCDPAMTVDALLAGLSPRVRDHLWAPLCVAALNTPPQRASAQSFLNVLRETFGAGAGATATVVPRNGLGDAIPERAAQWLVARGHAVHTSTRTRVVDIGGEGVVLETSAGTMRADAVVVAVGPHQLRQAFASEVARRHAGIADALRAVDTFEYEPIATVYVGYAAAVALPRGLLRLDEQPGQWLFDRADILRRAEPAPPPGVRALLSVVISAHGPHESLAHASLVAAIDAQLRRLTALPPLCWSQVIEEKRATYACVPALVRPAAGRLADRVFLAGDYTHSSLPATLEAAVRSGLAAARAVGPPIFRARCCA